MSIISALRTYISTYTGLASGAPVWVNYLGETPIEYSIVPVPGAVIVETDLAGNTVREYPFAFQSTESTADNLERLESMGFYEAFAEWLEQQTEDGVFPTLGAGQTPTKIEAVSSAFLFQQGESGTGIYQILGKLTYEQTATIESETSE